MSSAGSPADRDDIRVLIVDDHPILRHMVHMACDAAGGLNVVGEASDGPGALEACGLLEPDVVVLDLMLPGMDGFDVVGRLREQGLEVRVLVLSAKSDDETALRCLRAGVDGYVDKSASIDRITGAIRAVARGEQVFAFEHERAAVAELGRRVRDARETSGVVGSLTRRELEVLRLIGKGLTTRQAASRLRLSPRTVETHIAKLYRKLEVRTRVQAVARAAALHLIELG